MVTEKPIICPHCKKESGYTEQSLMFFCIMEDLKCHNCNQVVVYAKKVLY